MVFTVILSSMNRMACLTELKFLNFPGGSHGNSSQTSIYRGILKRAIFPLQYSRISSAVAYSPSFKRIQAMTSSRIWHRERTPPAHRES